MSNTLPSIAEHYLERLKKLLAGGERRLIGLVGAPGAGKSTLAEALAAAFPAVSQVVPMDGFHLANAELARLGRGHRKGAPDTFDSAGYAALLRRIRHQSADEIVYAPAFDRALEEPVAGSIPVQAETRLIITEGNYLLLEDGHWAKVASLLDETWYVATDDKLRVSRLTQRHERFGRSPEAAAAWVESTDEPNARLIERCKARADVVFEW
jgi:pantothenate kinase